MTTTWHVDDAALARWVDSTDGSISGASVEQHLLSCEQCRARVPAEPVLDAVWARVQDVVEVPPVSLLERALRRVGLPEADARIVAVSPAFRGAWLIGLATLLAFVTVAGGYGEGRGEWVFLAVAPLVPALAIALGYDPELDEALEQECATPYSRLRLVLLRSAALLVIAGPVFVATSLAVPGTIAFWWLAPAAGCTALVLALSTWVAPLTAVGGVATTWFVIVASIAQGGSPAEVVDERWVAVYATVCFAALVLLVVRRGRLATWRAT
ncbi:MAG TPA: hypothetical protein VM097_12135 [Mycobacteriales bacterium]|nr:hypothetical protein [Mycobacteriales bacterium]